MIPDNLKYEKELYDKGYRYIAGVDEVGRGPLAGPVVAGAVILDLKKLFNHYQNDRNNDVSAEDFREYSQINDSKKLSQKKREELSKFIIQNALAYNISEISNDIIDTKGIANATQIAFYNAVIGLKAKPDFVLIDAFKIKKWDQNKQLNIIKGDMLCMTIAAASIIAKVHRDHLMDALDKEFPQYGFATHKGYGTARHLEQIRLLGSCKIHRKSFDPVKSM